MSKGSTILHIIVFGGGILGFVIGAGFASGQEIMQFYTHLGFKGSIAAGILSLIVVSWLWATILEDGRKLQLEDQNDIFNYYCGKYIGKFFEWFVPILMFLVASIMISASGATFAEHYGMNPHVGRIIMAVATLLTVILGLRKLVHVVGYIAPVIAFFALFIGIVGIVSNPEGLANSGEALKTYEVSGPFSTWYITGFMYAAYLISGLMPYVAGIGKQAKNRIETIGGGIFAGLLFLVGIMVLGLGMLANLHLVHDKEIPSLAIISEQMPIVTAIFAISLLLAIYTTAVPMLWTAVNKVVHDDKSKKYKITAIILGILTYLGGMLKFSTMVGIVYPATGYLGILLIICIIYTKFFKNRKAKSKEDAA